MVIDDEGWKLNEHGRKHTSNMETELTVQENKNTKINSNGKMEEINAYVMDSKWITPLGMWFSSKISADGCPLRALK